MKTLKTRQFSLFSSRTTLADRNCNSVRDCVYTVSRASAAQRLFGGRISSVPIFFGIVIDVIFSRRVKEPTPEGKYSTCTHIFGRGWRPSRAGQHFWSNSGCPFSLLKTSHWPGIADGCLRNSGGSYLVCSKIWVTFFMWALFMFRGRQFIANWFNTEPLLNEVTPHHHWAMQQSIPVEQDVLDNLMGHPVFDTFWWNILNTP